MLILLHFAYGNVCVVAMTTMLSFCINDITTQQDNKDIVFDYNSVQSLN